MARKKANIHYIYKTTCNVTGRYYVGMHSTSNEKDGYMGSGKRLRYSIRKYGVDNHTKEILEYFDNRELLIEAEKTAITKEMVEDKDCMNLALGGNGGHGSKFLSKEQLQKGREKCDDILREKYGDNFRSEVSKNYFLNLSEEDRIINSDKIKLRLKEVNHNPNTFKGKTHSNETKDKMRESKLGKYDGENHPQYGSCWITKEGVNKKIKKEDLESCLKDGWIKGRVLK